MSGPQSTGDRTGDRHRGDASPATRTMRQVQALRARTNPMPNATTTTAATTASANDDITAAYLRIRPRLRRVAFRILGDWTEAEDIVQDAWLRWQGDDRTAV